MAQKLKFNANPTFKLTIQVPVAGKDEADELTLTFNHLSPKAFADVMTESMEGIQKEGITSEQQQDLMVKTIKSLAQGWAWEEAFNDENILHVINQYPAFYRAVTAQYGEELWKVREKN